MKAEAVVPKRSSFNSNTFREYHLTNTAAMGIAASVPDVINEGAQALSCSDRHHLILLMRTTSEVEVPCEMTSRLSRDQSKKKM